MYPLVLFSVISLAVIMEKSILILKLRIKNSLFRTIINLSEKKDFQSVREIIAGETDNSKSHSLSLVLLILEEGINSEEEYSLKIKTLLLKYSERIHYLDLVSRISPMTGLTGTVIGLAKTFQAVSSSGISADPLILAGGIWEAMITTITGLLIAIPALAASHILKNLINNYISKTKNLCDTVFHFKNNKGK